MRAVTQDRYGFDAVKLEERPIPEPGEGEVRVRVHTASMNPYDWHMASGRPAFLRLSQGLRRPKQDVIGADLCGTIDALGPGVTFFDVGDDVFGSASGAFAEYAIAKASRLAHKPDSMSEAEAAGLPIAGVTALQALEDIDLNGKRVVVNGASGGVGHYAVQIARAQGAAHVTGVCSTRNLEFVAGLGADDVIDYTGTTLADDFTTGKVDVLIDCAGRRSFSDVKRCLNPDGHWVLLGPEKGGPVLGPLPAIVGLLVRSKLSKVNLRSMMAEETKERLAELARLVNEGQLRTHIERDYPLEDIRAAFDHSGTHRTRGKVAITM